MKYIDYQRHIPADICVVRTPRYTYRIESVPGMTAIVRKDRLNVNSVHIHLTDIVRIAEGRFDEYQIPEKGWIYSDRAKEVAWAILKYADKIKTCSMTVEDFEKLIDEIKTIITTVAYIPEQKPVIPEEPTTIRRQKTLFEF